MTSYLSQIQWGLKGLEEVINIHPLFVHFPIALFLSAVAFYTIGSLLKKEELLIAGKWVLYLGTLAAAVTVWTGLRAAETVSHGEGTHTLMMIHQYIGITVLSLGVLLSLWLFFSKGNIPTKGRSLFLILLFLLGILLVQGADLGGRMVFLNGVGVGRKSMLREAEAPSHHHDQAHEHSSEHAH